MNLEFFDRFPVLYTDRLELRELQDEDAGALFDVFSDYEVTRFHDVVTMFPMSWALIKDVPPYEASRLLLWRQHFAEAGQEPDCLRPRD